MRAVEAISREINAIGIRGTIIRCIGTVASFSSEDAIIYSYVQRHFKEAIKNDEVIQDCYATNNELLNSNRRPVFVCWFQGVDNAPEVVKMCYKNLIFQQKDVVLLTDENIGDYIHFPDYILNKYERGIIGKAHFSDLLRTALVYFYGGGWIDATMLLTSHIPEYIFEQNFFVFVRQPNDWKYQMASNQFIFAKKGNIILKRTLNGMFYYWKKHNKIISYYLYHYMFGYVVKSSEDAYNMFKSMPIKLGSVNHVLQWRMAEKFNETEWEELCKATFVHKLTYKNTKQNILNKKTFYSEICKRYG